MRKKSIAVILFTTFVLAGALAGLASVDAVGPTNGAIPDVGPTTGQEALGIFTDISNWVFAFFLVGATIFLILAGLQFITGGGDPSAVGEARRKLLYALIGIGIAIMSTVLDDVIEDIITPTVMGDGAVFALGDLVVRVLF